VEPTDVVSCTNLSKDYGHGHGLFDVDLTLHQGEVFGLIGPNGAGKSTFIKLLMDFIKPSRGSVSIFGLDSQRASLELKTRIGYLPGEIMQFPGVTAGYITNLLLNLRGIDDRTYLHELAERLHLDLDRKFQDLSHGNKQKVALIQAFVHRPELLILDEPTLGLDPIIQRELRSMLTEFVDDGRTIILSSHVLSEVESICSRIGLIHQGRVIREGTLSDLRRERMHKISVIFRGSVPTASSLVELGATDVEVGDAMANFAVQGSVDSVIKLMSRFDVVEFDSRELSLEEVFFSEVQS
jgi:ABC-2 type transport system ATP-binding protein